MSTIGISGPSSLQVQRLVTMRQQLEDLQRQIGSQKKADTYAGVGADRGLTVTLRSRLSAISAYGDTITSANARMALAQTSLTQVGKGIDTVKQAVVNVTFMLDQNKQTQEQKTAYGQLDTMLAALNSRYGDQYIFSGRSTEQPAVADTDLILNGDGTHAGLKTVTEQRRQADVGDGLGRLTIPATQVSGTGAALAADKGGSLTGTADLVGHALNTPGGNLVINGTTIAIPAHATADQVLAAINDPTTVASTHVTASLDQQNRLVLQGQTGDDALDLTGTDAGIVSYLGVTGTPSAPVNLLSQVPALSGQTLTVQVSGSPALSVTFGTGPGQVSTMAELNTALAGLAGGTATVDPKTGNLSIATTNPLASITVGGPSATFGAAPGTTTPPTSVVSLRQQLADGVFGFTLSSINTTITGATTAGPTGVPPSMGIDLATATPKDGDTVTFSLTLPDGTTEPVTLTAKTTGKDLGGTGGFTGSGGTVGGTPGPIAIQSSGLNGGVPVLVSNIVAGDTASSAAAKINAALAAASGGSAGVTASVVSGQLVLTEPNKKAIALSGDSSTLDSLGYTSGNRMSAAAADNQFVIGPDGTTTAASLKTALTGAVQKLASTSLTAASAIQASRNFFETDSTHPAQRVNGPPFDTATSLIAGTAANTVQWYTGEDSALSARATAGARVDDQITAQYGMRANEPAFSSAIANIAALAALSFTGNDSTDKVTYSALLQRIQTNLGTTQGVQTVQDVEADIASAQKSAQTAKDQHTQTSAATTDLLSSIEGINMEEVSAQILALQTNLSASLQTTAMLSKLSLVNYL